MEAEGLKGTDGFNENTQEAAGGEGNGQHILHNSQMFNQLNDFFLVWLQAICVRVCVEQYRVAVVSPLQALHGDCTVIACNCSV